MAEELLSLKWNNHQAHFVDILTFLREQEIFIDATLACGGKLYPAHKFVLSTCSDYFKQMFTKNPNKHPIVFMKDVSCRDLEALLDFMYNGEVNVPQSSLGSLIKTAEGLQIKGLAVPDDPPHSKKEIVKDKKEKLNFDQLSPPPKRLKVRERSPANNSASLSNSHGRVKSPSNTGCSSLVLPPEASVDEDSRTSAQSGLSEHSQSLNSKTNSIAHVNDEIGDNCDKVLHSRTSDEPSPGPSGVKSNFSKEEELDIKQEEVVDLGEEDGEWGATTEGDALDGSADGSLGAENTHFGDPLMTTGDSSLTSAGDHAMKRSARANVNTPVDPETHNIIGASDCIPDTSLSACLSGSEGLFSTMDRFLMDSGAAFKHPLNLSGTSSANCFPQESDDPSERPFPCPYCEARFKKKQHLQNHERIHTGEKYVCVVCGQGFSRMHILKHHIVRKHSGAGPQNSLVSP